MITWRTAVAVCTICLGTTILSAAEPPPRPNIVLILADDLGYSDVGCFGAERIRTPQIDRLAGEGTRFTSFYVSQAVCTASRAAIMTGCYANRVGLQGALNHTSNIGIAADELLLPELLHAQGYATAIFGKWHLGHRDPFLPTRNGFDTFQGLPYSNDNGPLHPVVRNIPALPWYRDAQVVEHDPDQSQFTRRLTDLAVTFIEQNRSRPFFLYVPHIMPHVPIFASQDYRGHSQAGLYGDVVEELDHSVGQIVAAVDRAGIAENTWIIFASDNGPFLSYGDHAGSAKPLREGKLTTFEGGMRTPCIMRYPGKIPKGRVSDEILATIDLLPTVAGLVGASLPSKPIDGRDIWPVLNDWPDRLSPRNSYYFYSGEELQAVRVGRWKLHFPHDYLTVAGEPGRNGKPANYENMKPLSIEQSGIRGIASRHGYTVARIELSLFDVQADPGETRNVVTEHPEVVSRLQQVAEAARDDLGDSLTNRQGRGVRPVGKL
jgi:arylsulfatase